MRVYAHTSGAVMKSFTSFGPSPASQVSPLAHGTVSETARQCPGQRAGRVFEGLAVDSESQTIDNARGEPLCQQLVRVVTAVLNEGGPQLQRAAQDDHPPDIQR